ncbi:MAG: DMT family transporter [Anaerolineales bacterium]
MPTTAKGARLKADLILLLTATIWGAAFVAQRTAAESSGVFLFNGLRFLLGALVLLPLAWRDGSLRNPLNWRRRSLLSTLIAGLLLFTAGTLQQMGLQYTTAGNAGFITGLYVVFIPVILAVVGRQHLRASIWVASLMAAVGLFLLSTGGELKLSLGDALVLAGALFFALHVIWIGQAVQRVDILPLAIGQYLLVGVSSMVIGVFTETNLSGVIANAWIAILYTGIFSIGMGYTLQAVGQRTAPPADAAILLSMEAPIAALFGWLLLDERLTAIQLLGCGLMLAGMLLAQIGTLKTMRAGYSLQKGAEAETRFHEP